MKLSEAMTELNDGKKIARKSWTDKMYLKLVDNEVSAFKPYLNIYSYDSSIISSDGWLIESDEKDYLFHEILEPLLSGCKAKLKSWNDAYIYFDYKEKEIVYQSMTKFYYQPDFKSLIADDWEVVE